jgi:hypothetical protein
VSTGVGWFKCIRLLLVFVYGIFRRDLLSATDWKVGKYFACCELWKLRDHNPHISAQDQSSPLGLFRITLGCTNGPPVLLPFQVQRGAKNLDIAELAAASGAVVADRARC